MTHRYYPKLHAGPSLGGEETWFCMGEDVPEGCEWRLGSGLRWHRYAPGSRMDRPLSETRIYQVRDVPLPDPEGWVQPDGSIVTLVKHLRGRTDLDLWEYRGSSKEGMWCAYSTTRKIIDTWDSEFAIHIRRRR